MDRVRWLRDGAARRLLPALLAASLALAACESTAPAGAAGPPGGGSPAAAAGSAAADASSAAASLPLAAASQPVAVAGEPVSPSAAAPSASASGESAASQPAPSASASGESAASPSASSSLAVPIVPVVDFRSTESSAGWTSIRTALAGGGPYSGLELVGADADAILAALHAARPGDPSRLVLAPSPAALARDLAAHRDRLGFLRASQVVPAVKALAWGKTDLFGTRRVKSLSAWPLTAELAQDPVPFDPSAVWTLWAGGDLGVDRRVALVVTYQHKGVDYPYDGGTAKITGSTCCSPFGWTLPVVVRTGGTPAATGVGGAMRDLISSADLAVANMEEPTPDHFTFHEHGTVFTGDPRLIAGIARAGIDVVSMASNHVGDGGRAGVLQTKASLLKYGIRSFGAGKDLAAARRPAVSSIAGVKVAILGYDAIPPASYFATASAAGSAPLTAAYVKADIAAARSAGAQVVIVYPHWGTEYTSGPSTFQREMAHLMIDAGADLVIGNHPHWVQAMEVYRGKPIWYALGNFTFDQTWSEPTLEGISLELTFRGPALVQAWIHPHVSIGGVQPNLLDPAGSGQRVLAPMYAASARLLPW